MGFRMAALKGARWLLWTFMGLIMVRGIASFVLPAPKAPAEAAAPPPAAAVAPDREPPAAFAALFAREYLTWSAGKESDRAARLQGLIAQGLDSQAGWSAGEKPLNQVAEATWPFAVRSPGEHQWLVTVAARVTTATAGGPQPRTVYLAVPVWGEAGSYVVYDYPTYVAGPAAPGARDSSPAGEQVLDSDGQIRTLLTGFFRAYAAGGAADVTYFLEPGATAGGLGGAQVFKAIADIAVRRSGQETWAGVLVTMADPLTGTSANQRYTLELVQRDGRWYIKQIVQKGA